MTQLWAIGLAVLAGILGGIGVVILKKGAKKINFNIIIGVGCCGLGMISFLISLRGGELSVLYPIISLQYIVSSLLSVKYLKEKMNLLKWAGIAAIIIGVSFIGLGA